MDWDPPTKLVDDLNPIAIKQKLERGGDELLLPGSIEINWLDLVLSLARTSTMESAVPYLSEEERQKLSYGNGYCEALKMNLFIDALSRRLLFKNGVDILADERRTSLEAGLGGPHDGTSGIPLAGQHARNSPFHSQELLEIRQNSRLCL
jgi:hypothetical protein